MPFAVVAALALLGTCPRARAQADEETASDAGGDGYAWGEPESRAAEPEDPLRIMGYVGAGLGFRPLRNLDPPFNQDFMSPAYLDLAGVVYLPGSELRHGVGLGVSTTLSNDVNSGVRMFRQWALTPAYYLLIPLRRLIPDLGHDWVQLQGHVGVPIVISQALGSPPDSSDVDVTFGGELGVGVNFKFLAGLGVYFEAQVAAYGGTSNTVHPVISADLGFVVDYEVLQ